MRAVVLESFQNFTSRFVEMPCRVSAPTILVESACVLIQFLEPFVDHDCVVSLESQNTLKQAQYSRSYDATIKVAPERCLCLLVWDNVLLVSLTCVAHSCAALSVRSTRASMERVFPIPISSARMPPPISLGSTMAIIRLVCSRRKEYMRKTHNVRLLGRGGSCQ